MMDAEPQVELRDRPGGRSFNTSPSTPTPRLHAGPEPLGLGLNFPLGDKPLHARTHTHTHTHTHTPSSGLFAKIVAGSCSLRQIMRAVRENEQCCPNSPVNIFSTQAVQNMLLSCFCVSFQCGTGMAPSVVLSSLFFSFFTKKHNNLT